MCYADAGPKRRVSDKDDGAVIGQAFFDGSDQHENELGEVRGGQRIGLLQVRLQSFHPKAS